MTGLDLAGLAAPARAEPARADASADHTPGVERISVSVPASSANLGPGYDCLGVALPMRNAVEVERRPGPLEVSVSGAGSEVLPSDESNLVVRSFAEVWDQPLDGLAFRMHNDVPLQAGPARRAPQSSPGSRQRSPCRAGRTAPTS